MNRRLPYRTGAFKLGFRLPDRRALDILARLPWADGTRPRVRLWLKKSAARPAGSRPRADAIRRAAERSRRAAERSCRTERPRSRALSPRRLRLELLADGRLQRARFRRLRTPTRGICRRVTGVSVRRPAAFRPAGSRFFIVLQRRCLLLQHPRQRVLR